MGVVEGVVGGTVDLVVCFVVDCVVDVVVPGAGGQGHPVKSGVVGPLTQPSQCSVFPQALRR